MTTTDQNPGPHAYEHPEDVIVCTEFCTKRKSETEASVGQNYFLVFKQRF